MSKESTRKAWQELHDELVEAVRKGDRDAVVEIADRAFRDELSLELKRRNVEASYALGMGRILEGQGEIDRAFEMYQLVKLRTPFHYLGYAACAFLHQHLGEPTAALDELETARKLNPLDLRLADETARAALKAERYQVALHHAIEATLLAHWQAADSGEQDRRRIDTLASLIGLSDKQLTTAIRHRAAHLQKACDNLLLSHTRVESEVRAHRKQKKASAPRPAERGRLLERANELRSMGIFDNLGDEQLFRLSQLIQPIKFDTAEVIFREGHDTRDIYLIRSGQLEIARKSPIGALVLTNIDPGSMLGEVAWLDDAGRSATAYGSEPGELYLLTSRDLDNAVDRDRELAVGMLWACWQTLASKIRVSNSQMERILEASGDAKSGHKGHSGDEVEYDDQVKLDILREKGLSAQELRLLATYSTEKKFSADQLIFAEGESGDELFIVLEGKVRISRTVPGFGEESLAILERGDFFGEMALIDRQPRSADARSHEKSSVVFSISRSRLDEILSMDPDAAVQFLTMLCRLLCRRLRAMNDRLMAWQVMSFHH